MRLVTLNLIQDRTRRDKLCKVFYVDAKSGDFA